MAMVGSDRRTPGRGLAVCILFVIYGLPIVYLITTAFKPPNEIFMHPSTIIFSPSLDSMSSIWNRDLFIAAKNSVIIAVGTSLIVLVLATLCAYGTTRMRVGPALSLLLVGLIALQMVPQANSVIPLFRVLVRLDLLGSRLGVIFALSAMLLPFSIIILRPFFASVPREVLEAARIDGASELRSFWHISLPLAKNGIATVGVLVWILGWGEFLYSVSFLPKTDLLPLSALVSQQVSSEGLLWGPLMALALIGVVPIVVVFLATQRLLAEGLTVGAGK